MKEEEEDKEEKRRSRMGEECRSRGMKEEKEVLLASF